jgi:co-chaperonin GroES (HSP10)
MKAGLNKLVLEQVVEESKSTIIIQDHLKIKNFKVVAVGSPRTNFEIPTTIKKDDVVTIVPGTGYDVKVNGSEYKVCTLDDVLVVH